MDHLAQDLTIALEESESCGPIAFDSSGRRWGMRRRTRSAGNLRMWLEERNTANLRYNVPDLYCNKSGDNHSEDSSSSNSEVKAPAAAATAATGGERGGPGRLASFHQSDSDEMSLGLVVARAMGTRNSLRMKPPLQAFLKGRYNRLGMTYSLESDSFNEHSPARPSLRRKRKLKRMSMDETPILPQCGKRKRAHRLEITDNCRSLRVIKPLHQSIVDKIEKFCQHTPENEDCEMETQYVNDNCEVASESSLSWSGGEGHEGDDELTDWAPSMENSSSMDQSSWSGTDPREIRAGCRRLREERPGFSINTSANERVARFLQDTTKSELHLIGVDKEKLSQLAALYYLDLWSEDSGSSLLRKTTRTPCMQQPQRHHTGHSAGHKRIRTLHHIVS